MDILSENNSNSSSFKSESGMPDRETLSTINEYRRRHAFGISCAVFLYILSVACVAGFPAVAATFNFPSVAKAAIIGLLCMFVLIALATGLIIYTNGSIPIEVKPYIKGKRFPSADFHYDAAAAYSARTAYPRPVLDSFLKLYWLIVTIVYLAISFSTMAWGVTWLIWLIATAIKEAITLIAGAAENDE